MPNIGDAYEKLPEWKRGAVVEPHHKRCCTFTGGPCDCNAMIWEDVIRADQTRIVVEEMESSAKTHSELGGNYAGCVLVAEARRIKSKYISPSR